MATIHSSRDAFTYGSSPINTPSDIRERDSASPVSSYGDDLMETDKEDELTSEVDRSFSQTLSVSDAFESVPSPLGKSHTATANKRHGMTLPRMIPSMLHGADDDDDDDEDLDDDALHGNGYFGAMAPLSPTGGARLTRRPALGQGSRQRTTQTSSRLGQLQHRPSAFTIADATSSKPEDRTRRTFGRELGRENIVNPEQRSQLAARPSLKLHSQSQTDIGFKIPKTASLSGTVRASAGTENEDPTFRPVAVKTRQPLPAFTIMQRPSPKRGDSAPILRDRDTYASRHAVKRNARSFADNCMDIDSPPRIGHMRTDTLPESPLPSGTPLTGSPGLGDFFGSDASPDGKMLEARSARDEPMIGSGTESSPGSVIDSPSNPRMGGNPGRAFEKSFSCGVAGMGSLYGNRVSSNLASRRREPYNKRPLLIATNTAHEIPTHTATASALPVMDGKSGQPAAIFSLARVARTGGQPPMRRAHSVCHEGEGGETGRDHEGSSPSLGSGSNNGRVVSHIETGTSGLQAIQHLGGRLTPDSFGSVDASRSPYAQAGLLGFGANEMEGKVLPCHSVKEDGLVRVKRETVRDLLEGRYAGKISRYHIIDCRFGYEYEGGHIDGALNVNSNAAVEELLLTDGQGVHAQGHELPRPSRSGEAHGALPAIIIFHCEFSNKRAPAFAKHFRSRDRSVNQQEYPKVHFPELYILEGGYCDFFKTCPEKCAPQAYVPMDDPKHCERRDNNLHDFRKFTRTRSFTYGEPQPPTRPAQPCQPLAFAPANTLLNRRVTSVMEEEDVHMTSPVAQTTKKPLMDWDSPGGSIDGSPCARYLNTARPGQSQEPIFGSTKHRVTGVRALGTAQGKRNFNRTASYAGTSNS